MNARLKLGIAIALLLVAVGQQAAVADEYRLQAGQPHPDFVLPRIDNGEPVALSQFRGKKVLLIHFASW